MKSVFSIFSLSFCFVVFSCQGDEGKPVDYGPAVPQAAVDNALNTPLGASDPLKIQMGQFVDVVQTQILEGQAYQTTGEIGTTVVGRDEQPTQIVFTILEKTVNYSDNKVIARELTRIANKNSATDPATPVASPAPSPAPIPAPAHASKIIRQSTSTPEYQKIYSKIFAAATSTPVTFHNLIVSNVSEDPPDAVKQQANCGGVTACKINVSKISFDMLVWNDPKTPDKIHREFSISGDVPFFANVMSECDSFLVPVGTVKTLVTLCSDVNNFRFTTP